MKTMRIATGILIFSTVLLTAKNVFAEEATDALPVSRNTEVQIKFIEDNSPTDPVNPIDPDPDKPIKPVDPTDPNKPVDPGTSGPLSLDYASILDFGEQLISVKDQIYFAKPQYLFDKDGAVDKDNPVPNYALVTDKRGGEKGWSLSVKQNGQFKSLKNNKELTGAEITFKNAEVISNSDSKAPSVVKNSFSLTSDGTGVAENVMSANEGEGFGTWIYRFGDDKTKAESIELSVPGSTAKESDVYKTSLTWTLTDTPVNK